jgi:hypothetical protein
LAAPIVSIVIVSARIASLSRRGRAKRLLMFTSDCNGDLPPKVLLLLFLAGRQALAAFQPGRPRRRGTISARAGGVNWKMA